MQNEYCVACPLKDEGTRILGQGLAEAPLVIVGEMGGTQELKAKRPLVGLAWQLLTRLIQQAEISMTDVYVTNSVACQTVPPRTPKAKEIACCKQRLFEEVRTRNPRVVLAIGKVAVKALLGRNTAIADSRGMVQYVDDLSAYVIATYHPAAVLRSPKLQRDLFTDISKARTLLTGEPQHAPQTIVVEYEIIDDPQRLAEFLCTTNRYPSVALDVETGSEGELLCLGLSVEPRKAVVLVGRALTERVDLISLWFSNKCCIGHNVKFDIKVLWRHGFTELSTGHDTMLMSYTHSMLVGGHGLKHLVREYLDFHEDYSEHTKQYLPMGLENCPPELLHKYNAHDAALTFLLYEKLLELLSTQDLFILQNFLYPASDVLAEMEHLGIMVDIPYLQELDKTLSVELSELVSKMHLAAGVEFNPNSTKQLTDIMYNKLGLPVPARWSTDADALKLLIKFTDHEFPKLLLYYRNRQKFHSTYVRGLLSAADASARVHTTFNLHTTVTGRLSSSKPVNLQNITRGPEARNIFIATPGNTLIECDLAQAEIRAWAWLSGDDALRSALVSGADIHTATACLMHGLTPEQVTKDLRTDAKRLAFGTLYMMTAETLATELGTTVSNAIDLQNKFFSAYSKGREWIKIVQQQVLQDGFYRTHFGRKLLFTGGEQNRSEMLRQAVNYPIQNLASEITIAALIRIHKEIKRGTLGKTRLLLTVHDSNMLETAETKGDIIAVAQAIKAETERDILDGWLPFTADVQMGRSWGALGDINTFKEGLT